MFVLNVNNSGAKLWSVFVKCRIWKDMNPLTSNTKNVLDKTGRN